MFFSLTVNSQTDSLRIKVIDVPRQIDDIYYVNQMAKIVNGKLYSGTDSSYFNIKGEKMLAVETFYNGFKIELMTFFENGKPEVHYQWKDQVRNGISKRWYKSGKVMFDEIMINGEAVGIQISYYENGVPCYIKNSKGGFSYGFYENGRASSYSKYLDSTQCIGSTDGQETIEWHENGQLKSKSVDNCGKQKFTWYYNDSVKLGEGTQIRMPLFMVGTYREWYSNGRLKFEKHFEDADSQERANIKTGTWKFWDEKGKLLKEENYEHNILKSIKNYQEGKSNKKAR